MHTGDSFVASSATSPHRISSFLPPAQTMQFPNQTSCHRWNEGRGRPCRSRRTQRRARHLPIPVPVSSCRRLRPWRPGGPAWGVWPTGDPSGLCQQSSAGGRPRGPGASGSPAAPVVELETPWSRGAFDLTEHHLTICGKQNQN